MSAAATILNKTCYFPHLLFFSYRNYIYPMIIFPPTPPKVKVIWNTFSKMLMLHFYIHKRTYDFSKTGHEFLHKNTAALLFTDQENSFSDSLERNTPCLSTNHVNSSFYTIIGLIESTEVLFTLCGASSDIPNIASERVLACKA